MDQAEDYREFEKLVVGLHALYPTASLSEATVPAWWRHLESYPWVVVERAFDLAPATSPGFCPTAEQVKTCAQVAAAQVARERAEQRQLNLLEAPRGSEEPDAVLQAFYAACDKCIDRVSHRELLEADEEVLEGLLVLLVRFYGHDAETYTRGDTSRCEPAMLGPTINHFRGRKHSSGAIVKGLRRVPSVFARFPTLGMFDDMIRGASLVGYPGFFFHAQGGP